MTNATAPFELKTYTVTMRKQYPAWNEHGDMPLGEFRAKSKKDAVTQARKQQTEYGNVDCLCWFKATEQE